VASVDSELAEAIAALLQAAPTVPAGRQIGASIYASHAITLIPPQVERVRRVLKGLRQELPFDHRFGECSLGQLEYEWDNLG
jgi:hypothetical protein